MPYDADILGIAGLHNLWELADALGSPAAADSKGTAPLTPGAALVFGDAATPAGIAGTSALFDGSGTSYLIVTPSPHALTASITMEFWFRPTDATPTHQGLVWNGNPGGDGYGVVFNYIGSRDLFVSYNGVGDYGVPATLADLGVWHHVVLPLDASGHGTLYFDGVLTTVNASGTPTAPSLFIIGYPNFKGNVAAVALYDGVLSPTQVAANYAAGIGGPPPGAGPVRRSGQQARGRDFDASFPSGQRRRSR